MRKALILLLLILLGTAPSHAGPESAPPPPQVGQQLPLGFFSLDLFHTAYDTPGHYPIIGFGGIRPSDAGVSWVGIEPHNGQFSFTKLDTWIGLSATNGQDMLLDLDRTPGWASSNPTSVDSTCNGCSWAPSDVDTGDNFYKAFVTAVVQHSLASAKPIKYYEIWNEIDGGFWKDTNAHMVIMTNDAAQIIHTLDPNAIVIAPSISSCCTSGNGLNALTNFLNAGGGANVDQISLHAYPSGTEPLYPDYILTQLVTVQNLKTTNGIGTKPVIYTEGSYNGSTKTSKTDAQQIAFLGQLHLNMWRNPSVNVTRFYWFQYDNATFGTLWTAAGGLTPEGVAYQQLENWMVGAIASTTPCTGPDPSGSIICSLILANGQAAQIMWNNTANTTVLLPSQFNQTQVLGNTTVTNIVNNSVTLTPIPTLVTAPIVPPPATGTSTISCPPPGCTFTGSGSLSMVGNNLPPSVTIAPKTASVQVNGTLQLVATVQQDPFNLGVTWSLSGPNCTGASCGKIAPLTSASGATVTYTAPPTSPGTVVITATAVLNQASFQSTLTVINPNPPPAGPTVNNVFAGPTSILSPTVSQANFTGFQGPSIGVIALNGNIADVISSMQLCQPGGVTCVNLTQGCPPAGSCYGGNSLPTQSSGAASFWYGLNVGTGFTNILVNCTACGSPYELAVFDITNGGGVDTVSVTGNVTFTATPVGPTITPKNANELVVCGINVFGNNNVSSVASPFTFVPVVGMNSVFGAGYFNAPDTSALSPAWTLLSNSVAVNYAAACGAFTVGTTPPNVNVQVAPTSTTLAPNGQQQFTALVGNDSANKGVKWSATCGGTACGTFSSPTTPSANPVTYTAPSGPSGPTAQVTLVNHTKAELTGTPATAAIPATSAGNTLCVFDTYSGTTGTLQVSDSKADAWGAPGATLHQSGNSGSWDCLPNVPAGVGSVTFTINGGGGGSQEIFTREYAGLVTAGVVDQSAQTTTFNNPMDSGLTPTTTNAADLLIGYGFNGSASSFAVGNDGQGDTYGNLDSQTFIGSAVEDFALTTTTNKYKATLNPNVASGSGMFVIALKAAGTSSGGNSGTGGGATPTFSDTFSSGSLDTTKWQVNPFTTANYVGAGSTYTSQADHCDFSTGMLRIRLDQPTTGTSTGCQLQSKQSFGYGTYVWSIRASTTSTTPTGTGTTQSGQISTGFIISDSTSKTEIDSPEIEGQFPRQIEFTNWLNGHNSGAAISNASFNPQDGFHTYSFVWTSTSVTYYIDGVQVAVHAPPTDTNIPSATNPGFVLIDHYGTNSSSFGGVATPGVTRYLYCNSFQYFAPSSGGGGGTGGAGTVTVTATSIADTTKAANATVNVVTSVVPIQVTVSPSSGTLTAGTGQLSMTPSVANDSANGGVTITLNGLGSISATSASSGTAIFYNPPATVSAATNVVVTFTSVTDTSKSASTVILVNPASGGTTPPPSSTCAQTGNCQAFIGAFGNAEGGGARSVGGSGRQCAEGCSGPTGTPQVFLVDQTGDAGGSCSSPPNATKVGFSGCTMRQALQATGPRFIIFRAQPTSAIVNGSRLAISQPYFYVAGQTAPGGPWEFGGVGQSGETFQIQTHDGIIRYVIWDGNAGCTVVNGVCRYDTGPAIGSVGLEIGNGTNPHDDIIDHAGQRWQGNKGTFSFTNCPTCNVHNVTFSYNLLAEPNIGHPVLASPDTDQGGSQLATKNIDYSHNFSINYDHRMALFNIGSTHYVNNLSYNALQNESSFEFNFWGGLTADIVGNAYYDGPQSTNPNYVFTGQRASMQNNDPANASLCASNPAVCTPDGANCSPTCDALGLPSIYMLNNIGHIGLNTGQNSPLAAATHVVNDAVQQSMANQGWEGGQQPHSGVVFGNWPSSWFRSTPQPAETYPITQDDVTTLQNTIPAIAGAYAHLDCQGNLVTNRGQEERRVVLQFQKRTGGSMFASPGYNGSLTAPPIPKGTLCAMSLGDGIYDGWKQKWNFSLTDMTFWKKKDPVSGYLMIEDFLNGIAPTAP